MRSIKKVLLAATLAVMALSAFASTASASRSLSLNPGGPFTATSQGLVSLGIPGVSTTTCLITLNGTLGRAIAKSAGAHLGHITTGQTACNPFLGTAITANLQAFPWRLTYNTFLGRLPTPNGILFTVNGARFNLAGPPFPVGGCTFQSNVGALLGFSGTSPNTSGLIRILTQSTPLVSGAAGCPTTGQLAGAFNFAPRSTLILIN